MTLKPKFPKPGAGARLRKLYFDIKKSLKPSKELMQATSKKGKNNASNSRRVKKF